MSEYLTCLDCSYRFHEDDALTCSLDAYAEAGDSDTFCPRCESDNLRREELVEAEGALAALAGCLFGLAYGGWLGYQAWEFLGRPTL